ncbi:MAG: endonuclease/exonuclease/phosphatase family protein [Undibacterium sp.]|nr:endonuclease/exonuclease/phosphatase family protein [Undibacterium sp.]
MELRIASYNIHKGVSAFGRNSRIHELKTAIKSLDADLIFLQEVQGQHDLHAKNHAHWPSHGQHEFIAGDTHQHAYGMNSVYEHGHHGNALLSRLPILHSTNHDISDHAYEQRGILHVQVQLGQTHLHCFVIHLGLFASSRRRQINALIEQIHQQVDPLHPLIIAGDFNDWGQKLSACLYQELGVVEAFSQQAFTQTVSTSGSGSGLANWLHRTTGHAPTFPAAMPCLSLDRIYLRGFQVQHAKVNRGTPWNKLSDHVPISVSLKLNDQPSNHG